MSRTRLPLLLAALAVGLSAGPGLAADSADDLHVYYEPVETSACSGHHAACSYCCRPCGTLYAQVDGLVMDRTNGRSDRAIVLDGSQLPNEVLLTVEDLDFDFTGGVRALVGIPLDECKALEFGYFGLFDSNATAVVAGDDNLTIPGRLGRKSNDFLSADIMRVGYDSNIHSAEINCVKCCWCENDCCGYRSLEWLAGFRYLRLDEEFDITSTDFDEGTSVYDIDTDNNLYGAQLGLRVRRQRSRLGCELVGKAGIFGNDASQRQFVTDFPPPFLLRDPRGDRESQVAFLGELGLSLTYQLTDRWTLRGGYNVMWLEGVATAPDQLDFSFRADSGTDLNTEGGLFLHGANAGLEVCW
jgi:hypothetical protein